MFYWDWLTKTMRNSAEKSSISEKIAQILRHRDRVILPVLFYSFLLLIFRINKPFIGHHDWNGAFWGNITRNYLYNFQMFAGITPVQPDFVNPGKVVFFFHYTPFMPLLFTVSSLFLGLSEISMRIVTVFLSVMMVYYIYLTGKYLYSKNTGIAASLFASATPMFAYFGKMPDHEPMLTPFCIAAYYHYLVSGKGKNIILFGMFMLSALLESWGGFFLLAVIFITEILSGKRRKRIFLLLAFLAFAVLGLQGALIVSYHGPGYIPELFRYGLIRAGINSTGTIIRFSPFQFLETEARYAVIYFTRILLFFTLLWFLRFLNRKTSRARDILLLPLFVYGLIFVLFFRNLSYIHDYKLYLLLPFISLSSASALFSLIHFVRAKFPRAILTGKMFLAAVSCAVLLMAAYERSAYLRTLLMSSFDKPGYDLGNMIAKRTRTGDKVFLNSSEFEGFYGNFTRFYANREIASGDLKRGEAENIVTGQYRFVVLIDNRPADRDLFEYLTGNFETEKEGDYTFVDVNKPR